MSSLSIARIDPHRCLFHRDIMILMLQWDQKYIYLRGRVKLQDIIISSAYFFL